MNYLKLKERIGRAIHNRPMDIEAYNDLFALCRNYEAQDFTVAHEWNRGLRMLITYGLRMVLNKEDFTNMLSCAVPLTQDR